MAARIGRLSVIGLLLRVARFVPERRANGHSPSSIGKQRPIDPNACIDPALLSPYIANPATSETP